jgi:hypothetical protein
MTFRVTPHFLPYPKAVTLLFKDKKMIFSYPASTQFATATLTKCCGQLRELRLKRIIAVWTQAVFITDRTLSPTEKGASNELP